MTDSETKKEAALVSLTQCFLPSRHCERVTSIDVRNASGHEDSRRSRKQQGGLCERFPAQSFAKPDCTVAQFLQLGSCLPYFAAGLALKRARPDSDLLQRHSRRFHFTNFLIRLILPHNSKRAGRGLPKLERPFGSVLGLANGDALGSTVDFAARGHLRSRTNSLPAS